jgi:hypothetical protein
MAKARVPLVTWERLARAMISGSVEFRASVSGGAPLPGRQGFAVACGLVTDWVFSAESILILTLNFQLKPS